MQYFRCSTFCVNLRNADYTVRVTFCRIIEHFNWDFTLEGYPDIALYMGQYQKDFLLLQTGWTPWNFLSN